MIMPKLIILGTSNAVPAERHENTHLAVVSRERTILIDCAGTPVVRLNQAGIEPNQITDVVLTHFHPDHVSGIPMLLMDSWLLGRRDPLHIYGLADTLDRLQKVMDQFGWSSWPDFYPVYFKPLEPEEQSLVISGVEVEVRASPVRHLLPTIGLRFDFPQSGKSAAYSSDTEPCQEVARLAAGVDLLIHEATGESSGHSSAAQAGQIAAQAGAKELYLIHYSTRQADPELLVSQAQKTFSGPVKLAQDLMQLDF